MPGHAGDGQETWVTTTHDWRHPVDEAHLASVQEDPGYAAGGVEHLVLEVLAYADEEAQSQGRPGNVVVTRHDDGSVSVADDGRGTDTRYDDAGRPVRKPVMATKDVRFFDAPEPPALPDGRARRGMSTVAALSTWLDHTNRRRDGSWTQRYEHGVPATELVGLPPSPGTGTTVRFLPDPHLVTDGPLDVRRLEAFEHLRVELTTQAPVAG